MSKRGVSPPVGGRLANAAGRYVPLSSPWSFEIAWSERVVAHDPVGASGVVGALQAQRVAVREAIQECDGSQDEIVDERKQDPRVDGTQHGRQSKPCPRQLGGRPPEEQSDE